MLLTTEGILPRVPIPGAVFIPVSDAAGTAGRDINAELQEIASSIALALSGHLPDDYRAASRIGRQPVTSAMLQPA